MKQIQAVIPTQGTRRDRVAKLQAQDGRVAGRIVRFTCNGGTVVEIEKRNMARFEEGYPVDAGIREPGTHAAGQAGIEASRTLRYAKVTLK